MRSSRPALKSDRAAIGRPSLAWTRTPPPRAAMRAIAFLAAVGVLAASSPAFAQQRAAAEPDDDESQESSATSRGERDGRDNVPQRADREDPRRVRVERSVTPQIDVAPATAIPAPPRPAAPAGQPARPHVTAASRPVAAPPAAAPVRRPPLQAPPSKATRTVEEIIRASQEGLDFFELVDEMLDEIAHQLGKEDPNQISPMAIRMVRVSANLRPEFAGTLESRLLARIANATNIKMTVCTECTALHSRVEDGNWMVTLGVVRQQDLRRLGEQTGVKTFMDVGFTFSAEANVIWIDATAFRASDGGVVWTDAFRSDGTTAALLRTGTRIPSRAERAAELEQKLNARPNYGYAGSLGIMQVGYTAPTGNVTGAQVALRFHERFGELQSNVFGLSAGIFTTGPPNSNKQPQALNSILLGAYYSRNLSQPNLNRPELWVYGEGGGVFSGNEGNTFYVEGGVDLHLKWRLSLVAGAMYMFVTKYASYDLGGPGFRLRLALNW